MRGRPYRLGDHSVSLLRLLSTAQTFHDQPAMRLRPPIVGPLLGTYLLGALLGLSRIFIPSPGLDASALRWYAVVWPYALVIAGAACIVATLLSASRNRAVFEAVAVGVYLSLMLGYLVSLVSVAIGFGVSHVPAILIPLFLMNLPLWRELNILLETSEIDSEEGADHGRTA